MPKITNTTPKTAAPVRSGGTGVIRPMYGVVIRDNLAKFRAEIGVTISDTKTAIAQGDPKGTEMPGDGVLQGSELKKAKAAVKDLEKAFKALKPVFGDLGTPKPVSDRDARANIGRTPTGSGPIAMYGVIFRDDLSKFRGEIQTNISDIRAAINGGQLKGTAKTEAQKALKFLDAAMKDLGSAGTIWR